LAVILTARHKNGILRRKVASPPAGKIQPFLSLRPRTAWLGRPGGLHSNNEYLN
jgi:hypothetical protein